MGSLTCLERVFTKLLKPNVYKYGECLGKESKNGIKVYERLEDNGNRVLTSLKDGELYKTTEISSYGKRATSRFNETNTNRHDVIVRNHETGNVFYSYRGTTKNFDGTRDEFRGTSLSKPNFGELEAQKTQNKYRGDQLIQQYNTKISKDGTLYRQESKSYNADNELEHVGVELRARNYKMPNGQIVNYDRTQHFLPKGAYGREKDVRYLEHTARQIEITQNGVNQFDSRWMNEYAKNYNKKPEIWEG